MASTLGSSSVCALVPAVFLFLMLCTHIGVTAVPSFLRTNRAALLTSQTHQDIWAFVGPCVGSWRPLRGKALGCSSALGSFASFFRRRQSVPGAFDPQQDEQPQHHREQPQKHTAVDLYRLMGVPSDATASAISARANQLQDLLQQLSAVRPAAIDSLLSSLLREVTTVLQDPQQRAAFDREGLIPASLSALLTQLPVGAPTPVSPFEGNEDDTAAEGTISDENKKEVGGPSDLFSALFEGGLMGPSLFGRAATVRPGRPQPQQGPNVDASISLGFAAAALEGAPSLPLTVQRLEECDACRGTGGAGGSKPTACKTCEGSGMKSEGQLQPPRCGSCGGHGREERNATLQVSIPPGVSDGSVLAVKEQGSAGKHGGARGQLYLTVRVESDGHLSRQGANVHSEETISLTDAALGGSKIVKTVDGEAELTIPPNSQPGQKLLLKGRGARIVGAPAGARGDHIVTLKVALPTKVTQEERQLLQRLRELQGNAGKGQLGGAPGGYACGESSGGEGNYESTQQ